MSLNDTLTLLAIVVIYHVGYYRRRDHHTSRDTTRQGQRSRCSYSIEPAHEYQKVYSNRYFTHDNHNIKEFEIKGCNLRLETVFFLCYNKTTNE